MRTEVTEPALTDLLDELRQAREVPIPAKEFADAKRSLIASFALTLESPQTLLNNAVTRYRYGLPADYWDRYPERIMAITAADAQAMAKKYLDPSRLQIVAVGNGEAIARALRKLGTVEVYDAEGKKVTTYQMRRCAAASYHRAGASPGRFVPASGTDAEAPLEIARVLAARYPESPIMSYIPGVAWSGALRLAAAHRRGEVEGEAAPRDAAVHLRREARDRDSRTS